MGTLNRGGQKEGAAVSLTILNSISSLVAENSLNQTAAGQQKALEQLSSGLKINSSADDAAGLAIAMGLQANTTALAQSYVNANNGVSFLQVADGALSQVTSLLDRAVTLATESASSGLSSQQRGAANTEYQSILNEIDQIGSATQFNGTQVFTDGNTSPVQLANGGNTVTGTINPADTLSGGFMVTSTVPAVSGGAATADALTDSSGISSSATITSGAALTGNIVINATVPAGTGTPQNINFATSYPPNCTTTLTSSAITAGETLSGLLTFTNALGTPYTVDLADYQGLASATPATASSAAGTLGNDINTHLSGSGQSYSASISNGQLTISIHSPQVAFNGVGNTETSTVPIQTGNALHGEINIGASGNWDMIDMSNPSYAGLTSSDSSIRATALGQLGADLTTVMNDGSSYTASLDGGNHLVFTSQAGHTLSIFGTDTLWQEAASPFTSSAQQAVPTPQTTTPTTVSIAGVATSDLQSYLQGELGTDYTVSYSSNALTITLNSGNTDGVTSFTTTGSSIDQSVGGTPAVNTPTTVDLAGLTKTNLASSLLTQLGGDYTVSYDQNSGALSIGISSAGTSAGITSIASSGNNAVETAPTGTTGLSAMNIFTSDGTANGGTSLDVTVGSLTTANLGTANGSAGTDLSSTNLNSQASSASALGLITTAVNGISSQRGVVGANINRLLATASDIGTEQINLTSASNSIMNADIGKAVANMTQYNILQSTGMASLQQANQAQQAVLKLLQ